MDVRLRTILNNPLFSGVPVVVPSHYWNTRSLVPPIQTTPKPKREVESQGPPSIWSTAASTIALPVKLESSLDKLQAILDRVGNIKEEDVTRILDHHLRAPLQKQMAEFEPLIKDATGAMGIMHEISAAFLKVFTGIKILTPIILPVFVAYLVERLLQSRPRWVKLVCIGLSVALAVSGYAVLAETVTTEVHELMENPEARSEGLGGILGATAKLVVTILAAKGFSLTEVSFGTFLSKYAGISKGLESIMADAYNLLAEICGTCSEYIPVCVMNTIASDGPVRKFVEKANAFNVRYRSHLVPPTDTSKAEIAMLIKDGENLVAARKGNSGEDTLLRSYVASLHKVQDLLIATMGSSSISRRPVVALFLGVPGTGKTLTMNSISDTHIRYIFQDNPSALAVYEANSRTFSHGRITDKFWEGVNPAIEVIKFDDFGQATTVPGQLPNQWSDMIALANEEPFQPPMAFAKAEYVINPSMILATTNLTDLKTNMINSPGAFGRRIDVVIDVVKNAEREPVAENGYDPKASLYCVRKLVGIGFKPTNVTLTYDELYAYLAERARTYEAFARVTSGNSKAIAEKAIKAYSEMSDAKLQSLMDKVNVVSGRQAAPLVKGRKIMVPKEVPVPGEVQTEADGDDLEEAFPIDWEGLMNDKHIPLEERAALRAYTESVAETDYIPGSRYDIDESGYVSESTASAEEAALFPPVYSEEELARFRSIDRNDIVIRTRADGSRIATPRMVGTFPRQTREFPTYEDEPPQPTVDDDLTDHHVRRALLELLGVRMSCVFVAFAIRDKMGPAYESARKWSYEQWCKFVTLVKWPWFRQAIADYEMTEAERATLDPRGGQRWYNKIVDLGCWSSLIDSLRNKFWEAAQAVYSFVKKYKLMIGVIAAVTFAAFGLSKTCESAFDLDVEDQSAGGGRFNMKNGAQPVKRASVKARLAAMKNAPNAAVETEAQGFADIDQLVTLYRKNIYSLYVHDANGLKTRLGNVLGLKDKIFAMNIHYFNMVTVAWVNMLATGSGDPSKCCFFLEKDGVESKFGLEDIEVKEEKEYNDSLILRVNKLPRQFVDITMHFMNEDQNFAVLVNHSMVSEGMLVGPKEVYAYPYSMPQKSKVMNPRDPDMVQEIRNCLAYKLSTAKGMCGWPIVITTGAYAGKIFGFHCAGDGQWGFANRISTKNFLTFSVETPVTAPIPNIEVAEREVVSEAFALSSLPPSMDILCDNFAAPSNTFISNNIVPYMGAGPPPCERKTAPTDVHPDRYPVARSAYVPTDVSDVDWPKMVVIRDELTRHLCACAANVTMRNYTLHEAIVGIPGTSFRSLDPSTSPGYPHTERGDLRRDFWKLDGAGEPLVGPKFPQLRHDIGAKLDLIVNEDCVPLFVFQTVHKGERRSLAKVAAGQTRIVFCGPLELLIMYRMYFGAADLVVKEGAPFNGTLIGVNPKGATWDTVVRLLKFADEAQHCGSGDYKGYDGHQNQKMVRNSLECMANMYDPSDVVGGRVRKALINAIVESYHVFGRILEQWHDNMPSGFPGTTPVNCITNISIFMYHYLTIKEFDVSLLPDFWSDVRLVVMGDDNLFAVVNELKHSFTEATFAVTAAKFGHVYTSADKTAPHSVNTPLVNHSILKCGFRFHEDLGRYVGPLKMDVVMERVLWTKDNKDYHIIARNNYNDSLLDLTMYGKAVFEEKSRLLSAFYGPSVEPLWSTYEVALSKAADAVDGFI
jgi:hypothetical protein